MKQNSCREIQSKLSQYLDGRLSSGLMERVGAHLERCETCAAIHGRMGVVTAAVSGRRTEPLPDDLLRKIDRDWAVAVASQRQDSGWSWWSYAAGFLLFAGSIAGAFFLGRMNPSLTDTTPAQLVSFDEQTRAARMLAADVGVIDHIPENYRRPFLKEQLERFRLPEWAQVVQKKVKGDADLTMLAGFVHDLDTQLSGPAESWNPEALRRNVFDARVLTRSGSRPVPMPPRRPVSLAATSMSSSLSREEREMLTMLMATKEVIIRRMTLPDTMRADLESMPEAFNTVVAANVVCCAPELRNLGILVPATATLKERAPEFLHRLVTNKEGGVAAPMVNMDDEELVNQILGAILGEVSLKITEVGNSRELKIQLKIDR